MAFNLNPKMHRAPKESSDDKNVDNLQFYGIMQVS